VLVMCRRLSRVNARVAERVRLKWDEGLVGAGEREVCKLFLVLRLSNHTALIANK
jgi:hypothetical protein